MTVNDAVPDRRPDERSDYHVGREMGMIVHPRQGDAARQRVGDHRNDPASRSGGEYRGHSECFRRFARGKGLAAGEGMEFIRVASLARTETTNDLFQDRSHDARSEELRLDGISTGVPPFGVLEQESSAERDNRHPDSRV